MKPFSFSLCLLILLYMAGCQASRPVVINQTLPSKNIQQVTSNNTNIWWTQQGPGERYTLIKIDSTGKINVLAAQAAEPDFLKTLKPDSNIQVKGTIDATQLLKLQTQLALFYQKSSSLRITNEALYRLAEAYFNGLIDSTKYERLYNQVILQSTAIIDSEIELEEAKAETIQAETEKARIELQRRQLEFRMLQWEKGMKVEEENIPTPKEEKDTTSTK